MSKECMEMVEFVMEELEVNEITYDILNTALGIAMAMWRELRDEVSYFISEELEWYIAEDY